MQVVVMIAGLTINFCVPTVARFPGFGQGGGARKQMWHAGLAPVPQPFGNGKRDF